MRRVVTFLSLFFVFFLGAIEAYGYELVLPREKKTATGNKYAFFVGKAANSESVMINDKRIYVASNGAFAHSVKLKDGENRIVIRSNYNTQIYKIYKTPSSKPIEEEICDFVITPALVKKDNTPIRNTPIDAGMNRIAHLFEGTTVLLNGSKGNFYRVFLSKDKEAWIAKKDVDTKCKTFAEPAVFLNMDSQNFKNASINTISFTKNLPYTVEEKDKEILFKVYNPEYSKESVYTLNIPKPEKYFYHINLENGLYTFKVREIPQTIEEQTIVIDPGHGGSEKGAIGCLGDEEKNINLKIALELQEILTQMGANVIMTRECDGTVSLDDRVDIAKKNNANIFISIHLNSIGDVEMSLLKHKGTSVYYYNPNSKALAECLEDSISKSINTRKDGVRTASFAVIRSTDYVGVLVETAYMTNPLDSVLYTSENFAKNTAQGIVNGILQYLAK